MRTRVKLFLTAFILFLAQNVAKAVSTEYVTMDVGETKTLYLPFTVTSKDLRSVNFVAVSPNYVDISYRSSFSVTVKASKATTTPVIIRCDYTYYELRNGTYVYGGTGFYDWAITVNEIKPVSINVYPTSVSMYPGDKQTMSVSVYPSNADQQCSWSTSDSRVAYVDDLNTLHAVGQGYAVVTARTSNGKTSSCNVNVMSKEKITLRANPAGGNVKSGTSVTLTSSVYGANIYYTTDGTTPTTYSYRYSSPITVNSSMTLKARAYRDGYETSDILTEQYTILVEQKRSVTTSSAGYATFYDSSYAFELPESLSASVVTDANNNKLTYNKIADGATSNNVVPKGVAVMLASSQKKASSYTLTSTDKTVSYTGTNLLKGSDATTMTNGGSDSYYYKLSYGHTGTNLSNVFGWYWGAANGGAFQIDGHKAWLVIPKSAGAKGYVSFTEDEATAIQDIEDATGDASIYYDLQGRRVNAPTSRGIYIQNGKKVVINK